MKIRFYGKLRERLGAEVDIDPPAGTNTIVELRDVLAGMFPEDSLDLLERSRACVADAIVNDGYTLAGQETVEFFPPLSGG